MTPDRPRHQGGGDASALSPDILEILVRAAAGAGAAMPGADGAGILAGVLAEIPRTILPRTFHFADGGQVRGQARVANGRIEGMELTNTVPRQMTAIGKGDPRPRDAQVQATARALLGLALSGDDLTLTVALSPDDAEPDVPAFSAAELGDALAVMGLAGADGRLHLSGLLAVLNDQPPVMGQRADATDGLAGQTQRLTAALADLRPEIHALLGDQVLFYQAGRDDMGLVMALGGPEAQGVPARASDLDRVMRLWRGQGRS